MNAILRLLVTLGIQSLRAHRTKSLIVGGLMGFGAFLVVITAALQGSLERSMRQAIVDSVTGDIQLYSKSARDPLAIFGGFGFGTEDLGEIQKVGDARARIAAHPNVRAVIPMGITNASFSTPGDLDRALEGLRDAVRSGDAEKRRSSGQRVRQIATVMRDQQEKSAALQDNKNAGEEKAVLDRVSSDALWAEMDTDALATLDWLDTKLAPLGEEGGLVYLRMIGTDIAQFAEQFDKLKIVEGEMVPPGKRGLLIGQRGLDANEKMSIARTLDQIKTERAKGKTLADDTLLQELAQRNVRQARSILYSLPPNDEPVVAAALKDALAVPAPTDTVALLQELLRVTDENFDARYQLFYEVIAPRIQLYPFKVGDTITLSAFTKSGFLRRANVKVWGTYAFEGLEASDLAGGLSLVDIITFRELYGQRTAALDAELVAMKANVGLKDVARADAEAALFGGDGPVETAATAPAAPAAEADEADEAAPAPTSFGGREERLRLLEEATYTTQDVDNGLAISLAVQLKDPDRLRETLAELEALGEPLGLQALDWQRAAGSIGQFIWVLRGVLGVAILVIFIVAMVIINNSMVMATLERVAEIGTLRALGAPRRFVTAMVLFETGVLGIVAGLAGALVAAGLVLMLGRVGIPAPNDILVFLFAGPRLFPTVGPGDIAFGVLTATVVALAATLYPARLATGIQPVVAMQGKE